MLPDASAIVGIGVDLIDPARLARVLEYAAGTFRGHVFTAEEWSDCEHRADRVHALAERFAVKEACLKALGSGWAEGITLPEVALRENGRRSYAVVLSGAAEARARSMSVSTVHVTIAHAPDAAAALVILTT